MQLTAENVHTILMDCLFRNGEDSTVHVEAEGVLLYLGFHPERLTSHNNDIDDMINQLPAQFKDIAGGGSSFLNACNTANGSQWGEHSNIDELVCLGIAIGRISYPLPREIWPDLPGGMPYFVVKEGEYRKK